MSTSILYTTSASAPFYSHYSSDESPATSSLVDADADPTSISDPSMDEEAYVLLTPRFLVPYVRKALTLLRQGKSHRPTAVDILASLQKVEAIKCTRVAVSTVEEALRLTRAA